ncbi:histone deacetylase complex subunit SAP30 [Marmota monax]|nr:histone deacetylase complex subunit SAP30 [Marmota monax]
MSSFSKQPGAGFRTQAPHDSRSQPQALSTVHRRRRQAGRGYLVFGRRPPNLGCRVHCRRRVGRLRDLAGRGGAGISVSASALEHLDMNGFTPEEMSRGGDAAAAVAAVVAAAAAAASAGNGNAAGAGAEVPGAGAVSAAGPPGAAGPGPGQLCCLREDGERCGRAAGNASFSKRIQKSISQKKVKIELDKSARHLYICDYHKNLIQSVRNRRKRKGSDDDGGDSPVQDIDTPEVDLYQLQVNTLRRYKRHFKLPTRPGLNKAQLVEIVGCHFRSIPVNEKDTLTYFIYSVKNDKNKSDLKVDSGVH